MAARPVLVLLARIWLVEIEGVAAADRTDEAGTDAPDERGGLGLEILGVLDWDIDGVPVAAAETAEAETWTWDDPAIELATEPATDEAAAEPAGDDPATEPATDEAAIEPAAWDDPATEPATDEAAIEPAAWDDPATDEPATDDPAIDEPTTDDPAMDEGATEEALRDGANPETEPDVAMTDWK